MSTWPKATVRDVAFPDEEWRTIPSEPLYMASSLGRIFSTISGKVLSPGAHRSGHLSVCPRSQTRSVHGLVLEAFVGPMPAGQEIRHLDGDPTNNVVGNLAYGTRSENMQDMLRHGTNSQLNKTHCPRGHRYDEGNTRTRPGSTGRWCNACVAAREAERRALVENSGQVPPSVKHGASTYRYWNCRCEVCCSAKKAASAAERLRARERAAARS